MGTWRARLDSDGFRRFAKHGAGRAVFSSPAYQRANLERHRVMARQATRTDPALFGEVQAFCLTIGHTKCGASLLGGLLDAHERIVCSDEHDALRYVAAGFGREQLFHVLERGARAEARKGRVTARRLEPYSFAVPGQWQGRTTRPLVVGDTTTGRTTRRLAADDRLLGRTLEVLDGVALRLVHVVRNPFDPLSVMRVRGERSVEDAVTHFFAGCAQVQRIRGRLDPDQVLTVRHEDVVADPHGALRRLCVHLGVSADPRWLEASAAVVGPRPAPRHTLVRWDPVDVAAIEARIAEVDFLEGYTHDA
jgi:hypothetical protein